MSSEEKKRKMEQTSSSSSHRKKGHGKGTSNTSRRHVQKKTKTEEQQQTVTQEHIYPTTVREVLNYRQSGRKEDVPDDIACGVPYAIKNAGARCEGMVDIHL